MRKRQARCIAFVGLGLGITLLGLFTPILAVTAFLQTPGEDQNRIFTTTTSLPALCPAYADTDSSTPSSPVLASSASTLIRLRTGAFDPLQPLSNGHTIVQNISQMPDATLRLIQFPGPIQERWYQAMVEAGLEVVSYIPDYTYLVWGDDQAMQMVHSAVPVRWSGLFKPKDALHPSFQAQLPAQAVIDVVVQLFDSASTRRTRTSIITRAAEMLRPSMTIRAYTYLSLKVAAADITWISTLPGVISVEPLLKPHLSDEIQGQIVAGYLTADGSRPAGNGYLSWLTATVGLPTTPSAYPIIDITDDGIDDGDATPNHPDFYAFGDITQSSRLIYNANWTTDPSADGVGGHGNLNASIAGGYNDRTGTAFEDSAGYNYGLGINPFAPLAGSKVFGNTSGWANPVYADVVEYSYTQGARISSNSWGDDVGTGQYQVDDQIYDMLVRDAALSTPGNQEMTILFSAGNSGAQPTTIGSPGNAKNVITVGASESYRPTWIDGCWIGPSGADNANDIAIFSSRGPTTDGRIKPDIVAPGTHIIGAATQIPTYTGRYVCDKYYPVGQTLYAASSGTSHATPAVAGAASLFYRYYKDHYDDNGAWPSPAMVKAALINAAQYLDGASTGDTLPSPHQGFGAVNLGPAFDGTPRVVDDQTKVFQYSGESTTLRGYISDAGQPFRVTLAWTDAPGAVVGDAYVNNLNLIVEVGEQTYLGNVFSGGASISGGTADARNNVESVFLPAGVQGPFKITILAENIAGDGVPGNGDPTDQDYALICYNCTRADTFTLEVTPQQRTICTGSDAVYSITSANYAGQPASIDLKASGHPSPSVATFDPNPIMAGSSSTLTVGDTTDIAAGVYTIGITGETLSNTHVVTALLHINDSLPETTTLESPANMAIDISLNPTLHWLPASQTDLYAVEIATDTHFTDLVYSAVTESLTHTVQIALSPETGYYWRITPQNICGQAMPSASRFFTTRTASLIVTRTPELPIPDYEKDPNGIFDTITVTDAGVLIDMDVAISITHSWVGDLRISLEHLETGTLVNLVDRPGYPEFPFGCSGGDLDIVLDDAAPLAVEDNCQNTTNAYLLGARYSPNESLALFNEEAWKGHWTLRVSDHYTADTGILHQWSLIPTLSTSTDNILSFSQDTFSVQSNAPTAVITVTLDSTPADTVTVAYTTEPLDALPGVDYLTTTGILTFVHFPQQTFLVPILDNPGNVVSKTLMVSLYNPTNATLTSPYTAPLHILSTQQHYYFYLQFILKR
jgi:subtilisin-like proprotein convertase family protein